MLSEFSSSLAEIIFEIQTRTYTHIRYLSKHGVLECYSYMLAIYNTIHVRYTTISFLLKSFFNQSKRYSEWINLGLLSHHHHIAMFLWQITVVFDKCFDWIHSVRFVHSFVYICVYQSIHRKHKTRFTSNCYRNKKANWMRFPYLANNAKQTYLSLPLFAFLY